MLHIGGGMTVRLRIRRQCDAAVMTITPAILKTLVRKSGRSLPFSIADGKLGHSPSRRYESATRLPNRSKAPNPWLPTTPQPLGLGRLQIGILVRMKLKWVAGH
jgi:antitoxin component of MazEF toxin-antitoxin module